MEKLSDEALVKAYIKALESNLDPDFIRLFKKEIDYRELCLDDFDLMAME